MCRCCMSACQMQKQGDASPNLAVDGCGSTAVCEARWTECLAQLRRLPSAAIDS